MAAGFSTTVVPFFHSFSSFSGNSSFQGRSDHFMCSLSERDIGRIVPVTTAFILAIGLEKVSGSFSCIYGDCRSFHSKVHFSSCRAGRTPLKLLIIIACHYRSYGSKVHILFPYRTVLRYEGPHNFLFFSFRSFQFIGASRM